jgi:hypothetical protein
MKSLQRWKQTALHNKALVLTSVLVAFGTLFYAVAAVVQIWILKQSGEQAAEQASRIIGNLNWLARSMNSALKESRRAEEAIRRQSQAALDASIEISRDDQRAWVGVEGFTGSIAVGKPLDFTVAFRNSGKTPALGLIVRVRSEVRLKGDKAPFAYPNVPRSRGVLQPNGIDSISSIDGHVLDQFTYSRIRSGEVIAYVHGLVSYNDIFFRAHWLKFCFFLTSNATSYQVCENYNDVDRKPTGPITPG